MARPRAATIWRRIRRCKGRNSLIRVAISAVSADPSSAALSSTSCRLPLFRGELPSSIRKFMAVIVIGLVLMARYDCMHNTIFEGAAGVTDSSSQNEGIVASGALRNSGVDSIVLLSGPGCPTDSGVARLWSCPIRKETIDDW